MRRQAATRSASRIYVCLACVLFAERATAQDSQAEIARRDLISRAETARRAGQHESAVESATRAAQIRVTPSLRLLLAQEHEALGHVLDALEQARACAREAEADAGLRNRDALMAGCREIAARIEPRVGHLVVRVEGTSPSGLRLRVGDRDLAAALLGVPYPIVPGDVSVSAEADGYARFAEMVSVRAGAQAEVTVRMLRVAETPTPPRPDGTASPHAASGSENPRESPGETGVGPWLLVSVGAAGVLVGTGLLFYAQSQASERDSQCPDRRCSGTAFDNASSAEAARLWSTPSGAVTAAVGGALLLGGLVWRLAAPSQRRPSTTALVLPTPQGLSFNIGGTL